MKSGTLEGGKLVEDDTADTIEVRALLFYGSHIFHFKETVSGFRIRLTKVRECLFFLLTELYFF